MLTLKGPIDLVTAHTICWKCQGTTPVSYVRARQSVDTETQITVDDAKIVQPDYLAAAIAGPAQDLNPGLRVVRSDRIRTRYYWANHCVHCDAIHGEYSLHTEPDGPFFGGQIPDDAVEVRLLNTGEYEAASYAY